jgi:hypothetical protein
MKFLTTALLLVATSFNAISAGASQHVTFANGSAVVSLPAETTVIENESTLKAVFGPAKDHFLELSYNPLPEGRDESATGLEFVREAAKSKGEPVKETADRVSLMELGGDQKRDGRVVRVVHWQIGVKEGVFVLTITAPMPMSEALSEFLGNGLSLVANSANPVQRSNG